MLKWYLGQQICNSKHKIASYSEEAAVQSKNQLKPTCWKNGTHYLAIHSIKYKYKSIRFLLVYMQSRVLLLISITMSAVQVQIPLSPYKIITYILTVLASLGSITSFVYKTIGDNVSWTEQVLYILGPAIYYDIWQSDEETFILCSREGFC